MKIHMTKTMTGSYDGAHTNEYLIGREYTVGQDEISLELAEAFVADGDAVLVHDDGSQMGEEEAKAETENAQNTEKTPEATEETPTEETPS